MSASLTASLPTPAESQPTSIPLLARWLCFAILAVACFSGPMDISEGVGGDEAVRVGKVPSLLLKLTNAGAATLMGLWGLVCLPRARQVLTTIPGLMFCAVGLIFLLTCATSININVSLPICLFFLAYLLFIPTAIAVLEFRQLMGAALLACTAFTLCALLLYVFVPRIGVFSEEFNDGVIIERLGGMSQPNHVGRMALIGLLLCTYFLRVTKPLEARGLLAMLLGLFALAGVLAMSRTALLGTMVCLVVLNLDLLFTKVGFFLSWLLVLAGLAVLVLLLAAGKEDALAKKLIGSFTKTGDLEEVTQVTGRYDIWERTVKLIKGRPLQGYGLGSNKEMLKEHLQSTHNALLHPTLAAGVFAGGLTLMLLLWNLVNVFTYPNLMVRALSAYVIISGFTEDTVYEVFPGACTLLWMICCLLPAVTREPADTTSLT